MCVCVHSSVDSEGEFIRENYALWLTSCALSRSRVSSTASFLVVSVLSRNDVRRTDCALHKYREYFSSHKQEEIHSDIAGRTA